MSLKDIYNDVKPQKGEKLKDVAHDFFPVKDIMKVPSKLKDVVKSSFKKTMQGKLLHDPDKIKEETDSVEFNLFESKMAELDDAIRDHPSLKGQTIHSIKSNFRTHHNKTTGDRKYIIHHVVYSKTPSTHRELYGKPRGKYTTTFYNTPSSTDITHGLPKKLGGDIISTQD